MLIVLNSVFSPLLPGLSHVCDFEEKTVLVGLPESEAAPSDHFDDTGTGAERSSTTNNEQAEPQHSSAADMCVVLTWMCIMSTLTLKVVHDGPRFAFVRLHELMQGAIYRLNGSVLPSINNMGADGIDNSSDEHRQEHKVNIRLVLF